MLRESGLIEQLVEQPVEQPTGKRIDRFLSEAAGTDARAAIVFILGLAAIVLTTLVTR